MRGFALTLAFASIACAMASSNTEIASNNSTIKPTGPRAGTSNLSFFNVEGSTNATNASFGVMDWTASSFGFGTVSSVSSVSIALTEANAAFTTPGTVHFYFAANTSVDINNDGLSPLTWALNGTHNANGVDNGLSSLVDLGTGLFTTTGNVNSGQVDTYNFTITTPVQNYLTSALNGSGGVIRLVIAQEEAISPAGSATWAGYTNTSTNTQTGASYKPTMTLNAQAAPEPATLAVLSLGALGFIRRRNRK